MKSNYWDGGKGRRHEHELGSKQFMLHLLMREEKIPV